MSIATAIQAAQTKVANAYTAVNNKGGTLPATQNLSNLATAISSIPSGGGTSEKYGATIDTFLGDVNANGVLQQPTEQSDLVFTGVKDVADYGLYYKFMFSKVKSVSFPNLTTISGANACYSMIQNDEALTSISFLNLTTISGANACYTMIYGCTSLTSVSFPSLTTISATSACHGMLQGCTSLTSVSFPNLTTINGTNACNGMLQSCTSLTSVSFPNLTTINGTYACRYMLRICTSLTSASFPALTTTSFGPYTNQFNGMMTGTGSTTTHTLHFPSNLESIISGLSGYPLFGGTSGYVVCAFDLPATS